MHLEVCKLEYPDKVRKYFLAETKNLLKKLIQFKIYTKAPKILIDESGKRLYITFNEKYEKDKNIITKIKRGYSYDAETLDEIFEKERSLRLVNFLNIPPIQLSLKFMSYSELFYRKLFFWITQYLFILKLREYSLQKIGVKFDHPQTVLVAPGVHIDHMSPGLIFIDNHAIIGARTILQSHGMKSDKGYGFCYTIGPIYIMEGADIGSDCIILPGTIIGKDCAVYPMTVVKKDICPVYNKDNFFPVTYNQNEEYPYRLNISLAELKDMGLSTPVYFKKLKDKIVLAN